MKKLLLISIVSGFSFACHKGEELPFYVDPEAKQISVEQTPEDFKVPSSMWDSIEAMTAADAAPAAGGHGGGAAPPAGGEHGGAAPAAGAEHGGAEKPAGEHGQAAEAPVALIKPEKEAVSIPIVFANIGVYLKEKTEKALSKDAFHIQLPKGGGEVDFSRLIGEKNGSFYLAFDMESFQELTDLKVFFISETKKRKVEDEVLGMGCNKFVDITSLITKSQKEKGLLINTTRLRHLSVVGGHFVFVAKKEKQIFLTRVSFKDSKNPQLFCEREI